MPGLCGKFENQAGGGGVGVQRAVRADQSGLGGSQLAAAMDDLAFSPNPCHLGGEAFDEVHAKLGGGVASPGRHHGVHRAAQGRVEQGCEPAAMHGAQGVVVRQARRALKDRVPGANLDQQEVQRLGYRWVGEFAAQHRLHDLQPGLARDLLGPCHAGAGASVHRGANALLLRQPGFKVVDFGHAGSDRNKLYMQQL
jgi:hypothetical protein